MDIQSLAETSVHMLSSLFGGVLHGVGDRTANELYSVIARHLRTRTSREVLAAFEDSPESKDAESALVSTLHQQLRTDEDFRASVREIVLRAVRTSPTTITEQQILSADRSGVAAGRDVDQSKRTSFGGLTVGGVAIAVVLIVVLFAGGAVIVNVINEVSSGGLSGESTCVDYLASVDTAAKTEVMKELYLELGKSELAADPFIIQNTEYYCGNAPSVTLGEVAASRG